MKNSINRKFSVAPMLDWTDRHCRYLMRLISKRALLYTEMVTTGALLHGDKSRHLDYNHEEHPLALQLGGADPKELAQCAILAKKWGYDEINLNCGCPSDRVQSGHFGASLMREPEIVADCLKAIADTVSIPVTLKCRIGIDEQDDYETFRDFIYRVTHNTGCHTVIVHARKAWLKGLSPKENREIPPLHYEYVYQLKQDISNLEIVINGGITSLYECEHHLSYVDGVMMGRSAYQDPFILNQVDSQIFKIPGLNQSRHDISQKFLNYCQDQIKQGVRLHYLTRHMLGLYQQVPGAKKFRRYLSENAYKENAGIDTLAYALSLVSN
jgi:tRNA-dihydrouridine synthase A